MNPILRINEIDLSYNEKNVLEQVSFDIHPGVFVGLLGANGAGKSTLLLAMSGQFQPVRGRILFHDNDVYQQNLLYKQHIGFVHEQPFLYPGLSVLEFMEFVGAVKKVAKTRLDKQIPELLGGVNLTDQSYKPCAKLSQGMRKKLVIASAFLGQPQIVFLDEALNGIDLESIYKIKQMFRTFVNNGGTIILATHILEVLEKICDRFLILSNRILSADLSDTGIQQMKNQDPLFDLEQFIVKKLARQ